jgi:hypothetical protein
MQEHVASRLSVLDPATVASSDEERLENASSPFVASWNRLVSTTNWEKGQIIGQWREALIASGAEPTDYSDETWARRVGGVTGQHIRRLRRVFDRFGQVHQQYEGLYWSHFHAALDWDDAELWLEGAVQSGWSVSQMRRQRWDAMGALPDQQPSDQQIVVADTDEDCDPTLDRDDSVARRTAEPETVSGPLPEGPDFGDESPASGVDDGVDTLSSEEETGDEPIQFVRPFENLAELPEDLAEAFESF